MTGSRTSKFGAGRTNIVRVDELTKRDLPQIPRRLREGLELECPSCAARSLSTLFLRDGDLKRGTEAREWRGASLAISRGYALRRLR